MQAKRRKKNPNQLQDPLLPGTSLRFQENIGVSYEGVFIGYAVAIYNAEQADDLFESGFYGKGILSRSKPTWSSIRNEQLEVTLEKKERKFHRKRFSKKRKEYPKEKVENMNSNSNEEKTSFEEYLQLGLEEAFFLYNELKMLSIMNEKGEKMNADDCWNAFSKVSSRFTASYASYYHYRSNKWTPKYGNKYGVDWVLYQKGPTFYHAEKAVIVVSLDEESKTSVNESEREMNWLNIFNVNRVSEHVRKGLAICYVYIPKGGISSPKDIKNVKIEQIDLERWVPARTREIKEK